MRKRLIALFLTILIVASFTLSSCEFLNSNDDSIVSENYETIDSRLYSSYYQLHFRNDKLLVQHFEKHGKDMGFSSKEEYELAASKVATNPESLHKIEKEDGDDVYYLEKTNEFVVVSKDGYIRTYFNPDNGIDYFDKQ